MLELTPIAPRRSQWIAIFAIVVVVAFVIWQASTFGALATWTPWFGRQFPAFGVTVLLLVPILLIFAASAYVNRREIATLSETDAALVRATRLMRVLGVASAAIALAAVVALLLPLTLPSGSGAPRQVDARTVVDPESGTATVVGPLIRGQAVRYEKWIGPANRTYRLVPIKPAADGGPLRYFVEVPDMIEADSLDHSGVLIRNGLPRDAEDAFEAAGYRVASPNAVLFRDATSVRWPYYALAAQLLVVAALLMLAATLQWFTVRRIGRALAIPS